LRTVRFPGSVRGGGPERIAALAMLEQGADRPRSGIVAIDKVYEVSMRGRRIAPLPTSFIRALDGSIVRTVSSGSYGGLHVRTVEVADFKLTLSRQAVPKELARHVEVRLVIATRTPASELPDMHPGAAALAHDLHVALHRLCRNADG
jgi:hypothetical protein